MGWFLFKTEPTTYSYADLVRDKRAVWDGVSNPLALKHLRSIQSGDRVVIYHSGKDRAAVGLALATSSSYPDPKLGDEKHAVVDLKPDRALREPLPLATFRADEILRTSDLVRLARLSVMPLTEAQFERILELAGA